MWPIVFSTTGNDLVAVQGTLDASAKKIFAFLQGRGFARPPRDVSLLLLKEHLSKRRRRHGQTADR
jgi:hypothetical protein